MDFLETTKKIFLYYKSLGEKAMSQLEPDQLNFQYNEDSNSIASIVKHLEGNMMSRWTDFLTSDGEKPSRQRDQEFENESLSREKIIELWDRGWKNLFDALDSLTNEDLSKIVFIRNEGQTAMDAINRQIAHYPYHIGQIVFIAKSLKTSPWNSLSIPRNQSQGYNSDKFSKAKTIRSYTDDEIQKLKK